MVDSYQNGITGVTEAFHGGKECARNILLKNAR